MRFAFEPGSEVCDECVSEVASSSVDCCGFVWLGEEFSISSGGAVRCSVDRKASNNNPPNSKPNSPTSDYSRHLSAVANCVKRVGTAVSREERERELRAVREGCRSELERLKEEVTEREERAAKVLSSTTRKGWGGRGRRGRCGRGTRGRSVL